LKKQVPVGSNEAKILKSYKIYIYKSQLFKIFVLFNFSIFEKGEEMEVKINLFRGKFFERKAKNKEKDITLQVLLCGTGALLIFLLIFFVSSSKILALLSLFGIVSFGIMINAKQNNKKVY